MAYSAAAPRILFGHRPTAVAVWAGSLLSLCLLASLSYADTNMNTGQVQDSVIGNDNQQANGAGIAVNGGADNSNLNNNQNRNTNMAQSNVQPIMISQPTAGGGGSAALVLPRTPLALPNANLGRSNFGLQFGVQNNPGLSALSGGNNALGWFMQGGVTIPFGKIPSVLQNRQTAEMDKLRQDRQDTQRQVFGQVNPGAVAPHTQVQGRVVGLNAYNALPVSAGKRSVAVPVSAMQMGGLGDGGPPPPKVLALEPAEAFSQPLHTGDKIGTVELGREYPYLGHTRSGWVKILLPTGKEAWTSTHFEYIKHDYTEIDSLAVDTSVKPPARTATQGSNQKKRRS